MAYGLGGSCVRNLTTRTSPTQKKSTYEKEINVAIGLL